MASIPKNWDVDSDVVVVGSGGGALTCGIVARERGAEVTILECTDKIGGSTAYSGGLVWIANNHRMAEVGIADSREEAITYIRGVAGGRHSEEVLQAYVDVGPEMLKYIEEKASLEFEVVRPCPDYYAEMPGGKMEGRYVSPVLYDTKQLGDWQPTLRRSPHIPMAATAAEFDSWGGYTNMALWDWELIGQRMMDGIVGFGTSLVGPLMKACLDRGVKFMMQTRARELLQDASGWVIGVRGERDGHDVFVHGRLGVLLGCGGYEWNDELKRRYSAPDFSAYTVPSSRGDGHIMALELGAAWAQLDDSVGPCLGILGEEHEGQPLYRVFLQEPGRPRLIIVNRQGNRFGDEGFHREMGANCRRFDDKSQSHPNLPFFAIFDQKHKDTYTVGTCMAGEQAPPWMISDPSIRELAADLGIDPHNLEENVATFNEHAKEGKDPVFHRGETAYVRHWGDKNHKPSPCVGPIEQPPFYGFQLVLASAGTRSGIAINGNAQVVNVRGGVIPGLYASPNVAAHLALGLGLSSGQTIAQGLTFGYIAGKHTTERLAGK